MRAELPEEGIRYKHTIGIAPSKKIKWFSAEQCKNDDGEYLCKKCGMEVPQVKGRKQKLFCSDECRLSWYRLNRDMKGTYMAYCKHCGKEFLYYKGRKSTAAMSVMLRSGSKVKVTFL